MRIDPNARAQEAQDSAGTAASTSRGTAAAAQPRTLADDTAQLSGDQVRVQALTAQAIAVPEIRQEKVTALGQAVRNGSYHVSPELTAEAVISESLARASA